MGKEFKCRWPTSIERMAVGGGLTRADGKRHVSLKMACGPGVVGSVQLWPDDAIEVAQALAVERAKLLPMGGALQSVYPCTFFKDVKLTAGLGDHGDVEVRMDGALGYLTVAEAKALAMDLLAMTAHDD